MITRPGTRRDQESLDGTGAGDHDVPFTFGRLPRTVAPFPFSTHEFARLLVARGRLRADLAGADALRLRVARPSVSRSTSREALP
jgi:hypothetical protein